MSKTYDALNLVPIIPYFLILCTYSSIGNADEVNSFNIDFGILGWSESGYYLKEKTYSIPYRTRDEGQVFGLLIEPQKKEKYEFYVEITFPKKTEVLSGDLESQSSNGLKKVRSPVYSRSDTSANIMYLDAGDPAGRYKVCLYINDRLVRDFDFFVQEKKTQSKHQ